MAFDLMDEPAVSQLTYRRALEKMSKASLTQSKKTIHFGARNMISTRTADP